MNENTASATAIPSASSVKADTGGGAWRFANGLIRKGQKGAFVNYPEEKIVGILRRVGIHTGKKKDSDVQYIQVEGDIETSYGLEHFKSSLTDDNGLLKPSSATNGFVFGLLNIGKDEQIMITVTEANFETEKGGVPTFVNVWKSPNANWQFQQIIRPKRDKNAPKVSLTDQWLEMEDAFKAHPAFAERAAREDEDGGPTHFSEFCALCTDKGWPTPDQQPGAWIKQMAAAMEDDKIKTLADIPDEAWGEARLGCADLASMPKIVADNLVEQAAAAPAAASAPAEAPKVKAGAFQ